jgi:YD repeat-containing protein
VWTTDPMRGTLTFGYTGGNLTSQTTGDGRVSTMIYNAAGRVVQATSPTDGR